MSVCPVCRAGNQPTNRRCDQCGAPLQAGGGAAHGGEAVVTIGRAPSSMICLGEDNRQVSANHCRVYLSASTMHIEDLDSSNGTKINGTQIPAFVRTPFGVHDRVAFGSYDFNTAQLSRHRPVGGPAPPAYQPAFPGHAGAAPIAPMMPGLQGGGVPAAGPRTVFDRAFAIEDPLMGGLLVAFGVILIALFFVPLGVTKNDVITAISVLGEKSAPGLLKMALVLMPLTGIGLIVMRAANASRLVVGVTMLVIALLFGVGWMELVSKVPLHGLRGAGWHALLQWILLSGTAMAALFRGRRPGDEVGRVLLGIFAVLLTASYLLPVKVMGKSVVVASFMVDALGKAEAGPAVYIVLMLLPMVAGLAFLSFLSDDVARRHSNLAQSLSAMLAALPATAFFLLLLFVAIETERGALVISAVWWGMFMLILYSLPVLGGTLLMLDTRDKRR